MSQSGKVLKEFGAANVFGGSVEVLSGSGALGALSLSKEVSLISATDAVSVSLADGVSGQKKTVVAVAAAGNIVLTPASFANGTTITFDAALETIELIFTSAGWVSLGTTTTTIA